MKDIHHGFKVQLVLALMGLVLQSFIYLFTVGGLLGFLVVMFFVIMGYCYNKSFIRNYRK